jgi:hypothetical protein
VRRLGLMLVALIGFLIAFGIGLDLVLESPL